jgi:molecular chaperone GrpE (heat shock protein)
MANRTLIAQGYRREAERVRQLAEAAASEVVQAQLLDVAQQFEDLAAQAEMDNAAPHDR